MDSDHVPPVRDRYKVADVRRASCLSWRMLLEVCVCREGWQQCWTPMGESALPMWCVRLWYAFKQAATTKEPIQSYIPCFFSPLNPRGTWLPNTAKSNESQEALLPPIPQERKTPPQYSLAKAKQSSLILLVWMTRFLCWDETGIHVGENRTLATQQFGNSQISRYFFTLPFSCQ